MRLRTDQLHAVRRTKKGKDICAKCSRRDPDLGTICKGKAKQPAGAGSK